jgi:ABC-type transport system involved in multi-copper enzyme maturation permease subunit
MSTVALTTGRLAPSRSLVAADLLKLRRRRGLVAVTSLLTVGALILTYGIIELVHVADPAKYGPAGGIVNLGHGAWVAAALGAVAAAIVGAVAGAGDLDAGVYRDLVVTGRSRLALYRSRLAGGLVFLLPFVAVGYAVAAVATVVFAGSRPVPGVQLLATTGLWVLLQVTFYYLLAVGLACLLGSRSYTIGTLLGFRLALTPVFASISALGVVRELVPGVALQELTPAALGGSVRQGPDVPMSLAAIATVLVVWAVALVAAGAWRDTTRDA